MNPPGFYRIAKALALEIRFAQFETARGNALRWELYETRWNWLNVYRWDAGEDPEIYLSRTNGDFPNSSAFAKAPRRCDCEGDLEGRHQAYCAIYTRTPT